MMWHSSWSAAQWLVMGIGMLVFWSVVVAGVWWLVAGRRDTAAPGAQARQLLDERLARGDITPEEYRTRRDLLSTR